MLVLPPWSAAASLGFDSPTVWVAIPDEVHALMDSILLLHQLLAARPRVVVGELIGECCRPGAFARCAGLLSDELLQPLLYSGKQSAFCYDYR